MVWRNGKNVSRNIIAEFEELVKPKKLQKRQLLIIFIIIIEEKFPFIKKIKVLKITNKGKDKTKPKSFIFFISDNNNDHEKNNNNIINKKTVDNKEENSE
jgi:hypothetical protein